MYSLWPTAILAITFFLPQSTLQAADEERAVSVVGSVRFSDLPESILVQQAKEDARIKALEQGGGTYLQRESKTHNFRLVRDIISSRTWGILKDMQWGRPWSAGGFLKIELKAVVRVGQIGDDMAAIESVLERRGMPRIAVVTDETYGEPTVPANVLRLAVTSVLKEKGFDVIDRAAADMAGAREREELFTSPQVAAAFARRLQVDTVLAGQARVLKKHEKETSVPGLKAVGYDLSCQFSLVDQKLGFMFNPQQMTWSTKLATRGGECKRLQDDVQGLGRIMGQKRAAGLLADWCKDRQQIEILIAGITMQQIPVLRTELQKLGGRQTFTYTMRSGQAAVRYKSPFPETVVGEFLAVQKAVPMSVNLLEGKLMCRVGQSGMTVSMSAKPAQSSSPTADADKDKQKHAATPASPADA